MWASFDFTRVCAESREMSSDYSIFYIYLIILHRADLGYHFTKLYRKRARSLTALLQTGDARRLAQVCGGRFAAGVPSLAHPVRLPQRDRASLEKLLRELIDNGLQGLEVYHSEHSPEDTALYKDLAAQFNLIETGGTDYHGDNKPSIHLGTGKNNNMNTSYDLLENMRRGVAEFAAR